MLITTRPEGAAFLDAVDAQRIDLARLDRETSRRLVLAQASAVLDRQLSAAQVDDIVRRADGNPLMLEELTKGSLIPRKPGEPNLPLSVDTNLQPRLGTVSEHALALAATSSAIGREAPLDLLRGAWRSTSELFDAALSELVNEGIFEMTSQHQVRFHHQLLQEACYGMASSRNRMAIHERLYKAMQALPRGTVSDQQLYQHAERAGNLRAALDHLWSACMEAIRNDAIETAAQLFSDSFRIFAKLPEDMEERRSAFILMAFDPFQQLARQGELIAPLEEVRAWAKREDKRRQYIQACAHLGAAMWINGRHRPAYALAREGVDLARDARDLPVATYAQFVLANAEFACGHPHRSVERLGRLADSLTGELGRARFGAISQMGVMARAFRCWYLSDLDRFEEADASIREAEVILGDTEHDYSRLLIRVGKGYRLLRLGEAQAAADMLASAHELALHGSFHGLELSISGWRGAALMDLGDAHACHDITRASLQSDRPERVLNHGNYCVRESHARALFALDHVDQALEMIDMAVAVAKRNFDPISYAYGLYERARLRRDADIAGWQRDSRACRYLARRIGLPGLWRRAHAQLNADEGSSGIDL